MYVVNTVAVNTHTPGFPLITQRNSQRRACWWFPSKLDASLARILPASLPLVLLLFFFAPSPSPSFRQIASAGRLLTYMTTLSIQNPFPTALVACLLTLLASPFALANALPPLKSPHTLFSGSQPVQTVLSHSFCPAPPPHPSQTIITTSTLHLRSVHQLHSSHFPPLPAPFRPTPSPVAVRTRPREEHQIISDPTDLTLLLCALPWKATNPPTP